MIGQKLAHFEITAKLGEGGMGEVYQARDTKLGREVAIKVLPDAFVADPDRMARFGREARALAALNHPNIAGIYEIGEGELVPGRPVHFLVLELIPGETLAERIGRGALPVETALEIGRQIAHALEAAHDQGIIHRDLKPENVKLTPEGKVKVLDFGLAKALEADPSESADLSRSPTITQRATQAGVLMGTAPYMSPEQARGKAVDKRSDIWAFGCLLHEMITGKRPFAGETITDIFASIVAREPDWDALPPRTPAALRRLLRRCLEKDPAARLHHVADARLEIEEILASDLDGREEEPDGRTARSGLWKGIAAGMAALALGLGALAWIVSSRDEAVVRAFLPPPAGGQFHLDPVSPGPVVVSPDGRRVAFSALDGDGTVRLWLRDLEHLEARALPGTQGAQYPFWAPDSRHLGFFAGGRLKRIDTAGGPPLTLCEASNAKGGAWSPDGVILFTPGATTALYRVPAAGGDPVAVTELDREQREDSHRHPHFLPDGRHFLYVARRGEAGEGHRLLLGSLDGEASRELMRVESNVEYAAGHLLFTRGQVLMAQPFDPRRRELAGQPFPLAEHVVHLPGAVLSAFSASEGGLLAYQSGEVGLGLAALEWRDRQGHVLDTVGEREPYSEVRLSPDGRLAAVSIRRQDTGNRDLWIWNLERRVKSRFTFDPADDSPVVWSPDGERIAFSSNREAARDLYLKPVGGGEQERLLYRDDAEKWVWSWSPDGRHLLFSRAGDGPPDLRALSLDEDAEPLTLVSTQFIEAVPAVSPDGRWIAYMSDESGRFEIYVTAFPDGGRKWQVSTGGAAYPLWARQGRELLFVSFAGEIVSAEVDGRGATFEVGPLTPLFEWETPLPGGYRYDVTADGERFLLLAGAERGELPPMTLVLNWTAELTGR